jgi:hypothetical protein
MNLSWSGLKVHDSTFPPVGMFLASFKDSTLVPMGVLSALHDGAFCIRSQLLAAILWGIQFGSHCYLDLRMVFCNLLNTYTTLLLFDVLDQGDIL